MIPTIDHSGEGKTMETIQRSMVAMGSRGTFQALKLLYILK